MPNNSLELINPVVVPSDGGGGVGTLDDPLTRTAYGAGGTAPMAMPTYPGYYFTAEPALGLRREVAGRLKLTGVLDLINPISGTSLTAPGGASFGGLVSSVGLNAGTELIQNTGGISAGAGAITNTGGINAGSGTIKTTGLVQTAQLQVTAGSLTAGNVLISDGSGGAVWGPPGSSSGTFVARQSGAASAATPEAGNFNIRGGAAGTGVGLVQRLSVGTGSIPANDGDVLVQAALTAANLVLTAGFQMNVGTALAGKVLTANASGVGTWVDPLTISGDYVTLRSTTTGAGDNAAGGTKPHAHIAGSFIADGGLSGPTGTLYTSSGPQLTLQYGPTGSQVNVTVASDGALTVAQPAGTGTTFSGPVSATQLKIGANDINAAPTLSNVAYLSQANSFAASQSVNGNVTLLGAGSYLGLGGVTGANPPTLGSRSSGTRLVLTNTPNATNHLDMAFGVEGQCAWFSAPSYAWGFKFYYSDAAATPSVKLGAQLQAGAMLMPDSSSFGPAYGFLNEVDLGWTRGGVSRMSLSKGDLALPQDLYVGRDQQLIGYLHWGVSPQVYPPIFYSVARGRSVGTRMVLAPSPNTSNHLEYAIGVEANHTWLSVPAASYGWKFYYSDAGATPQALQVAYIGAYSIRGTIAGGAGYPTFAFIEDPGLGMYRAGANLIGFTGGLYASSIQLTAGAAAGRVLVSTSTGLGQWTDPTTLPGWGGGGTVTGNYVTTRSTPGGSPDLIGGATANFYVGGEGRVGTLLVNTSGSCLGNFQAGNFTTGGNVQVGGAFVEASPAGGGVIFDAGISGLGQPGNITFNQPGRFGLLDSGGGAFREANTSAGGQSATICVQRYVRTADTGGAGTLMPYSFFTQVVGHGNLNDVAAHYNLTGWIMCADVIRDNSNTRDICGVVGRGDTIHPSNAHARGIYAEANLRSTNAFASACGLEIDVRNWNITAPPWDGLANAKTIGLAIYGGLYGAGMYNTVGIVIGTQGHNDSAAPSIDAGFRHGLLFDGNGIAPGGYGIDFGRLYWSTTREDCVIRLPSGGYVNRVLVGDPATAGNKHFLETRGNDNVLWCSGTADSLQSLIIDAHGSGGQVAYFQYNSGNTSPNDKIFRVNGTCSAKAYQTAALLFVEQGLSLGRDGRLADPLPDRPLDWLPLWVDGVPVRVPIYAHPDPPEREWVDLQELPSEPTPIVPAPLVQRARLAAGA